MSAPILHAAHVSTNGPIVFSLTQGADGLVRLFVTGYEDIILNRGEGFDFSIEALGDRPVPVVLKIGRARL